MSEENKLVVFFDTVGRTILGERIASETTEEILTIKNPAVVHILPNQQTGQLQLQILPLFFKEFLADKSEPTVWQYKRELITESKDLVLDFKVQGQYQQIFSNIVLPASQTAGGKPDVIKLFDE
jgi:hypothetical protein